MPLQLITPAAEEPVSLAEAKRHLRVESADDDALIASLISAARQAAETLTGRQFVTARWKLVLDSFPGPSLMGVPAGLSFSLPGHAILLLKCPVHERCNLGARQRWCIEAGFLIEKHQGLPLRARLRLQLECHAGLSPPDAPGACVQYPGTLQPTATRALSATRRARCHRLHPKLLRRPLARPSTHSRAPRRAIPAST
jgi:hypothetical protein